MVGFATVGLPMWRVSLLAPSCRWLVSWSNLWLVCNLGWKTAARRIAMSHASNIWTTYLNVVCKISAGFHTRPISNEKHPEKHESECHPATLPTVGWPEVHYFSQWPIIVFNFGMVTPEAKCDHETHHGKWDVFKGFEGMDMSQN